MTFIIFIDIDILIYVNHHMKMFETKSIEVRNIDENVFFFL